MAGLSLDHSALSFLKPKSVKHLGVQLYSVRDDIRKAPRPTVEAVAKMGYKEVELFDYVEGKFFGITVKDFGKLLKDNGLKAPSGHFNLKIADLDLFAKMLSDRVKKAYDDYATLGLKYIVCPYIDANERDQLDKLLPVFDAAARYARKAGLRFAYHNHDFEFLLKSANGKSMMERLLTETDPAVVEFEMDMYWVNFANNNILDWINKYPGRWKLCHVKDMANSEKRETIEVGDGSIDFANVFKNGAKKAGLEYYIVELEHYKTTPLEGIKRCRENLMKIKF